MAFGPLVLRPGRWAARGRSGRRLASRGHQRARSSVLRKRRAPAPRCPGPARERAEPRDRRSFCGPPPASSPPLAGPSLVPCLSRVQTEVLTGMSAEQKRWSGGAGGKARTRGARARAGGRGAQAGRGSTEGVRAALPAASGTAAWTRRAHRRGPCAGRPHGAEGLPCVSGASRERRRPAHGQPRGEPRTRPPPARRTELAGGAPHFGVRPAVPAPARLRQLLASEAPRCGEGHHSLSWP